MRTFSACLILLLLTANSALAASSAERRGKAFAKANCSRCHAIDMRSSSRNEDAPPFRVLHKRYPVETLAEAFAEGVYTGHPEMPAFELDPRQINDLLAFLKSLE